MQLIMSLDTDDIDRLAWAWCAAHPCTDCRDQPEGQRMCQLQALRIAYEMAQEAQMRGTDRTHIGQPVHVVAYHLNPEPLEEPGVSLDGSE